MIDNMKDAARTALAVQNASNLSGIVRSWAQVQSVLSAEANRTGKGTDWRNSHPINQLFVVQVAHLTNLPIDLDFDYMSCVVKVEEIAEDTLR
jgi:hypothetical protein